jgi:hypothetical protein
MTDLWIEIDLRGQGLSGVDALGLRNAIEKRIVDKGAGNFMGGGVSVDGSSCDLEVRCEDDVGAERLVRQFLDELKLGHCASFRRN